MGVGDTYEAYALRRLWGSERRAAQEEDEAIDVRNKEFEWRRANCIDKRGGIKRRRWGKGGKNREHGEVEK